MNLLSDQFTAEITSSVLDRLGWRTVWLHAALTSPPADLLSPRDREVVALVATSAFGVDVDAVSHHLRRLGLTAASATSCINRLSGLGYVSVTGGRVDLGLDDLAWIESAVARRSLP